MKWISWIPTVGGRLSFSVIGETSHPTRAIGLNRSDGKSRHILVHQRRNLSDSLLGPLLAKWLFNLDTDFWFLVSAQCSDKSNNSCSNLTGYIAVFLNTDQQWRNFENSGYTALRKQLPDIDSDALERQYNEHYSSLYEKVKDHSFFIINFSLDRNGIVVLTSTKDEMKAHDSDSIVSSSDEYNVARQCFYFLKDVCHTHQHHHPKTDTLIDLQEKDSSGLWRENISRMLYRRILDHKRHKTLESFDSALGVLVYTKSFISLTKDSQYKICSDPIELNHDLIENSVAVKRNKLLHKQQRKSQQSDNLRTTVLVILGLIFSIMGLSRFLEEPPKLPEGSKFKWLIEKSVEHPGHVIVLSVIFAIVFYWLPSGSSLTKSSFFRSVIPWFLPWKRPVAVTASLAGTIMFAIAFLYLFQKSFS